MSKLTPKQELFVHEYLKDFNATQAYLRAGYEVSEAVAKTNGNRLLTKANVKAEIDRYRDRQRKKHEVTADKVIEQLSKIAFADIKDYVYWDTDGNVTVRPAEEIDGTIVTEISSKETDSSRDFKFKRSDQLKALELLGKHMKLFTDKQEVEHSGDVKVNFNIPRPKKGD